ncbi:MAG: substrate-binding domain-containing protein [Paludibacteraceae bacterium]|nr:substrate-binding domain-containing protein [Paludibacteraceae bacterium]
MRNTTLLACITGLFLVSCSTHEAQYTIGFSQCFDDAWRQKMNAEMERQLLFHPEMELRMRVAYGDDALQCAQIDSFIAEGVDALIVSPSAEEGVQSAVTRAYESGIPVVLADRRVSGDQWTAFIGGDNYGVGVQFSTWLKQVQSETDHRLLVLEICGMEGSTPARLRHQGLIEGLAINGEGVTLNSVNGSVSAYKAALAYLSVHKDVDAIVAQNDRMAIDASRAARDLDYPPLRIMGVDGASEGLQAIMEGVIECTATYPSRGDLLIETVAQILNGEPFTKDSILPSIIVDRGAAEAMLDLSSEMDHEVGTISMLKQRTDILSKEYRQQRTILWLIIILAVVTLFFLVYVWHLYRQRKRLHEQLLEAQSRLEEATRSKLTFFTNVSHDFRTPLTLIADPLGQLERDTALGEEQHRLVAIAHRNAQVLLRLINQVLDFRKYESGMLKPKMTCVEVGWALKEWVEAFQPLAKRRHVHLSYEAPEEAIEAVLDVEKTERIVFNLVANAFKFTPANGHVSVQLWREGEQVCFAIADTGSGVPEEYKQRIFDTFFQLDATNSQGSGIGLALVRSFVTLQSGTISVTDNPEGQGTVFTVCLPIGELSDVSFQPSKVSYQHISSEQILTELGTESTEETPVEGEDDKSIMLVVDDNADIRAYLRQLFSDTYTVITAENGNTGIRKAFISVPDIILCDLSMPDIDGLKVCEQLKKEPVTSHIPFMMLTARSMDEQQVEGYAHGADAYVSKPFKTEVLKAQVAALVANRQRVMSNQSSAVSHQKTELQTPEEQFVQRFNDIVRENLDDERLSVEVIADKMAMSRTQLYRKMKQLTHYSPNEIIRNVRMHEARAMLTKGTMTVSEIAYKTGFTSPSYFTRCYTEYFGEKPSDVKGKM